MTLTPEATPQCILKTVHDTWAFYKARVEACFSKHLPDQQSSPIKLHQAMAYALTNGGKRLRPALVYATGELFTIPLEQLDRLACAIEMLHCYSLVHDDLPIMDDDDFRRGQPSCHRVFGEATTLLAGNALYSLAYSLVEASSYFVAEERLQMLTQMTQSTGHQGLIGGQALEFEWINTDPQIKQLEQIFEWKTGALISLAVDLALIAADQWHETPHPLQEYAKALGLAFQIQDDILDYDPKDPSPVNYVTCVGLNEARETLAQCHTHCLAALSQFGARADFLRQLSAFLIHRQQ